MADETTAPVVDADDDLDLVALTPSEIQPAQQRLSSWCDAKTRVLQRELSDLEEHLLIAANNGWKLRGLQASITRTERRIAYYGKVKLAVDEGYLIVPNFPVTLLAARVKASKPRRRESESAWHVSSTKPQLLNAGEGRYVDEELFTTSYEYEEPDGKGGMRKRTSHVAADYDEPDFPYALVKPAVLAATQRAMALKVFDTIGMVENRSGRDPIMVGQILDPRGNQRRCTFFIAWWLNTRSL